MVPDADYRIKLQIFEGPLDLLLFLIRKNELDIYDIPIESVTRQYIEALRAMQQLDLEVAGEFFVMAATLMEIKSRMLLPRGLAAVDPNADDEGLDPRWDSYADRHTGGRHHEPHQGTRDAADDGWRTHDGPARRP